MKITLLILFALTAISEAASAFSDSVQAGWVKPYVSGYSPAFDFAYDIATDPSGNVIVSGSSCGANAKPDFIVIKYSPAGDTLWTRRYNGPGNDWDIARAITLDAAGNIYVTGETYSESTDFNYVTIKYGAGGNRLWVVQYDGPSSSDDGALDVAVDGLGNVFVTGHSWQSGTSWDFVTIKYNSAGQQQWLIRYNGPGNIADFAVAIVIDPSNNIYVTGTSDDLSVNFFPRYTTIKYNSSGAEQWVNRYYIYWSYASAIAVDNSGSVYVTGRSYAPGTGYDYATIKYTTSGAEQWVSRYNGPGNSDDYGIAIAIDGSGNVCVTGEAFFVQNEGSDYATIKYSANGTQQWVARYNGPASSVDVANDIVVDGIGNIYVTGESRGPVTEDDYATIKYNPSGAEQCAVRYNAPGNSFDLASAIALDASGNIYVTGRSAFVGGSTITTIKYIQVPLSVNHSGTEIPDEFSLEQNYPNPFNPVTSIIFGLPAAGNVQLIIYDISGKEVDMLVNEYVNAGYHTLSFDGSHLSSGVYFYKLSAEGFSQTRKMMLVK